MTSRRNDQPKIPFGISAGDTVLWLHGVDHEVERVGTVTDILSSQFLIESDGHNYIVAFNKVRPPR